MRRIILFLSSLALTVSWSTYSYADVLRYTDEAGRTHYVESLDKVPERFRSQLKDAKPLPGISKAPNVTYTNTYLAKAKREPAGHKRVEIFVTSWCPYCQKLEAYLKDKHISFTKYDIEKDSQGRKIHTQLGGGGVPVIRVGSKVLHGFNPIELDQIIKES